MARERTGTGQRGRIVAMAMAIAALPMLGGALAQAGEPVLDGVPGGGGELVVSGGGEALLDEDAIKRGEVEVAWPRAAVVVDLAAVAVHPALEDVPASLAEALEGVPADLPVLLPALAEHPEALASAFVTSGDGWYTAALQLEGGAVTLVVSGSNKAVVHPDLVEELGDLEPMKNDRGVLVSRTHGIVTGSFERFGEVAYGVDVECARPLEDARCTGDAFVQQVIDALVVVGGPAR